MTANKQIFLKAPGSVLDFKFDWAALTNGNGQSDWLASGETILSKTVTVEAGLTKDSDTLSDSNTSVTAWLSAGTQGEDYKVTCQIVTSDSRTDERSIIIRCRAR